MIILQKVVKMRKTNNLKYLLLIIILFSAALRFLGIFPGYNPYHADETMSYAPAWQMITDRNLDPKRYDYPSLIPLINLFFYLTLFIPIFLIKYLVLHTNLIFSFNQILDTFPNNIIGSNDLIPLYWSRFITAFLSTVLVYLCYKVSIQAFGSKLAGILSALILAVNYRIVLNSHFGLPDIYNAFFFSLSLLLTFNMLNKPSFRNYFFAGLGVAMSFNIKFQIFTILPFLIVHTYTSLKNSNYKCISIIKNFFSIKFFISIAIIPLISLILNPYHLINFSKFYESNYYTFLKYKASSSSVYGISYLFFIALSPIIFISVFLGIIISFIKRPLNSLILLSLSFGFLYNLLWGIGGAVYTRNFISVIPILLIFSGQFFFYIFQLIRKLFKSSFIANLVFISFLTMCLLPSLNNTIILDRNYFNLWEMKNMNSFIHKSFQNGIFSKEEEENIIASHPWDFLRIFSIPYDSSIYFKRIDLNPESAYSLKELQENGAKYALIGIDVVNVYNSWWMQNMNYLGFSFWQIKDKVLKNQFLSLAVSELTQQTLFAAIKAWQAPDNNFILVKIPQKIKGDLVMIKSFDFDRQEDVNNWSVVKKNNNQNYINWDQNEGYVSKGSIFYSQSLNLYHLYRIISPVIYIKEGRYYQVQAMVKSQSPLIKGQGDGFLRIDFYKNFPDQQDEFTIGDSTNISARYVGKRWLKLIASGFTPAQTKYALISFQVSSHISPHFWVDDVIISEIKNIDRNKVQKKTFNYTISNEVLFPFSQGGL